MSMTLRTDEELDRLLSELAEAEGVSRQEAVRRAIVERHQRLGHEGRVNASAERMIDRWGAVLDRLGTV